MQTILRITAIVLVNAFIGACGGPGPEQDQNDLPPRGQAGKQDTTGSCRDAAGKALCGGKGAGACYCDDLCVSYGDCCSDRAAVCLGGGGSSTGPITCAAAAKICSASPAGAAVYRLYRQAVRSDGVLSDDEVVRLAAFAKDRSGVYTPVKGFLQQLHALGSAAFTGSTRGLLGQYINGTPPNYASLQNNVYKLKLGAKPDSIFDDTIQLVGEGTVAGDTNLIGHSRGYAKKADGVLRFAHGSKAPDYPKVSTPAQTQQLRAQGPHLALDRAAAIYGLKLGQFGFKYLAEQVHYDPQAPYWAGICHAWSYTATDNRINALVEVDGPVGRRGIWIFGQWLSRADVGNWMMGVSSALSIADSETLDSFVKPVNLLKAVTQFVMTSGRGLRADFFNDTEKGASEVWNQPIYSAEVKVDAVTAEVAKVVIAHAEKKGPSYPPLPASPGVKLVQITAYWGVEVNDSYEGPAKLSKSRWAFYAVTDPAAGDAAVKGYMAHHLAKEGLTGLPVTTSDPLPDYYAFPKHALVDDALKDVANTLLDNANEGPYNRFMVGTVLPRGIPDEVRAAFESDFFAGTAVVELKQRYPGVANAYSPTQWQAVFAAKLGAGTAFGAVWGQGRP